MTGGVVSLVRYEVTFEGDALTRRLVVDLARANSTRCR